MDFIILFWFIVYIIFALCFSVVCYSLFDIKDKEKERIKLKKDLIVAEKALDRLNIFHNHLRVMCQGFISKGIPADEAWAGTLDIVEAKRIQINYVVSLRNRLGLPL